MRMQKGLEGRLTRARKRQQALAMNEAGIEGLKGTGQLIVVSSSPEVRSPSSAIRAYPCSWALFDMHVESLLAPEPGLLSTEIEII